MSVDPIAHEATFMPTSWHYGSFYNNSRLYLGNQIHESTFSNKQQSLDKDLATEDYYRALNEYRRIHTIKEEKKVLDRDKEYSVVLNESPDKENFLSKNKENLIVLPRETVYMIDKVVRQRTSRARLLVKDELLEELHNEEE